MLGFCWLYLLCTGARTETESAVGKSKGFGPWVEGIKMLLEAKVDVNHKTRGDRGTKCTPLHFAYEYNDTEVGFCVLLAWLDAAQGAMYR